MKTVINWQDMEWEFYYLYVFNKIREEGEDEIELNNLEAIERELLKYLKKEVGDG